MLNIALFNEIRNEDEKDQDLPLFHYQKYTLTLVATSMSLSNLAIVVLHC